MALIPGSYARAAGLQSEINKVTVTRVAGSELQFRRTIDTYQRDLRYHVNSIQREQKQLRRSMRRYYKRLKESKKEREQRKAKLQESNSHFGKTATSLDLKDADILHLPDADGEKSGEKHDAKSDGVISGSVVVISGGDDSNLVGEPHEHGDHLAESPDSGIIVDTDTEVLSTIAHANKSASKGFLTSTKSKAYLKAKRGQKDQSGSHSKKGDHPEYQENVDEELPAIAEEGEEDSDPLKESINKTSADVLSSNNHSDGNIAGIDESNNTDNSNNSVDKGNDRVEQEKSKTKPAVQPISVTSLNTRTVTQSVNSSQQENIETSGDENETSQLQNDSAEGSSNLSSLGLSALSRRKPQRRKTGVSFGDLIKLQHTPTSSTKQLFKLVDRMASKHGIIDTPQEDSLSKSSSLDPRTNVKFRRRSRVSKSQMSDGIVKHAAVLYSMKYGYNVPEEILPEIMQGHIMQSEWDDGKGGEENDGGRTDRSGYESDGTDGLVTVRMSDSETERQRKVSTAVSVRLDENGYVISTHPYKDIHSTSITAENDVFDSNEQFPHSPRTSRSRGRQGQQLSMSELSEHVTRIKTRNQEADSNTLTLHPGAPRSQSRSRKISLNASLESDVTHGQKLSPLPQRSRSLSRSRRESVNSQIQERLNDHGDQGLAWQSAFGRLKMVHTLVDLAPYFHKD